MSYNNDSLHTQSSFIIDEHHINTTLLPLSQAIKYVKGSGKRTIYEFSDPDCPFCEELEQLLLNINDLTIYLFLFPVTEIHPNAEFRANQIWNAKDRYAAWENYMLYRTAPDTSGDGENTPIEQNIALGRQLEITGTPTFFLENGFRVEGVLPAEDIERLLYQAE
ncbi:DsbC family protein [Acinetobacter populi]|jgi:thiol:disulfide interchange protein DsbC|uniref:Thiol:disulfide interchange protein n=1 Tax=Acinetobacter populi TaxID=1582270 RepID=A0A1Z9YU82_9GAMM|nr:DsbC family protein [Acinetobacter populi]MCH4246778.1 DsbC family protein [Acinetobacter populi]OUY05776.1 hypothetical protein CAP51_16310 [Acinetobacter populi]